MGKIIPVEYIGFKCCSDENLRRIFFASYPSSNPLCRTLDSESLAANVKLPGNPRIALRCQTAQEMQARTRLVGIGYVAMTGSLCWVCLGQYARLSHKKQQGTVVQSSPPQIMAKIPSK
jgi:hypothetical protein